MKFPVDPANAALGDWRVAFEDTARVFCRGQLHAVATRKALALLVLLVLEGAWARPRLARLLWPDVAPEAGRRNLRREVYRWRQAGLPLQDLDGQRLGLPPGAVTVGGNPAIGRWADALLGVAGEDLDDWLSCRARHVLEGAPSIPSPPAPARAPARAPAPPDTGPAVRVAGLPAPVFVEQPVMLAAIDQAWSAGRCVFLVGAPGMGKTRLALEAATRHGAVLRVAARPEDAGTPFAAVVRALRALRDAAPEVMLPDWVRETLAPLLPEWAPPGGVTAASGPDLPARLATAGAEAVRRLAADNFNVLVFDDWQWVDAESARWWMQLDAPAVGPTDAVPLPRRLVAYRAGALAPDVLAHVRAQCDAGLALRLALDEWPVDDVARLVAATLGAASSGLAARLHASTGGHPLFVLETLRWLQASGRLERRVEGGWDTAVGTTEGPLQTPPSVRDTVLARVHALGPAAARLLQAASLAVPPLRARALGQVAGDGFEAVDAALAHATAADLLVDDGSGLRFAHDLIRESLREAMSAPRREAWHAAWAAQAAADGAPPEQVAAHWDAAGDPRAACAWHVQAAESAQRLHALPQAAMHWRAALASNPPTGDAVVWGMACADVLERMDDVAGADAALRDAAAAADVWPALRRRVRAAQARLWSRSGRLDDAEALLAQVDPDASEGLHPVLTIIRAEIAQRRGQLDQALALCAQAASQWPDEPGALPAIAEALTGVARAAAQAGDFDTGLTACERGLALLRAVDAPLTRSALLSMLGVVQTWRGEREAARDTLARAAADAQRGGNPHARRMALLNLAKLHSDAGEIPACLALLDEIDRLPPAADAVRGELFATQVRWYAHWLCGALEDCRALLPRLLALAEATTDAYARLSTVQLVVDMPLLTGDLDQAQALIERAMGDPGLPQMGPIRTMVDNKRAWWLLRSRRPDEALEALTVAAPAELDEARQLRAAVRAEALLALGRIDEALACVRAESLDADGSGDAVARWLAAWWHCVHAADVAPDETLVAATEALLAGTRAPALDRQALQRAAALGGGATERPISRL